MKLKTLKRFHDEINAEFFGGKLARIPIYKTRSNTAAGFYNNDSIKICMTKGNFKALMAHEMIHQYQFESLDYDLDSMTNVQKHEGAFYSLAIRVADYYNWNLSDVISIEDLTE